MTTAADTIEGALRLNGQLGDGESASAQELTDALEVLNEFIDYLATQRLTIYSTQKQALTWPANTTSRTIGATGQISATKPVRIDPSSYVTYSGVDYPISIISEREYRALALKTVTSSMFDRIWVNYTEPDTTVTVYPVPSAELTFNMVSMVELTQPATSGTTLVLPEGYKRFFRYNLALALSAEYGLESPDTVKRIAASTFRAVKRMNKFDMTMKLPDLLAPRGRPDIEAGY